MRSESVAFGVVWVAVAGLAATGAILAGFRDPVGLGSLLELLGVSALLGLYAWRTRDG